MRDFLTRKDIAKLDFVKSMMWNLNIPKDLQKDLVTQSLQGHMLSGHGLFSGRAIPNTFIENVYNDLKKNPEKGRIKRESEIIEMFDLVDRLANGQTDQLLKSNGEPIMGFEPFRNYKIKNRLSGLKGGVIMGCVDDNFWRVDTVDKYKTTLSETPLEIGSGKEYLVNKNIMKKKNLTLEDLSNKTWSKSQIKDFRREGLIVREAGKNIENLFIRRNKGLGCCDDMMLTSIGLIHGEDAMIIAWALDAMDTYTKFIMNPLESGYDQVLAKRIHDTYLKKYGELIASPSEIRKIIYLGAKENTPKINLSSSHRRFIQTENGQSSPTINNHINYVKTGKRPKDYKLGFDKVSSDKFYDILEERFILNGDAQFLPKIQYTKIKNTKRRRGNHGKK